MTWLARSPSGTASPSSRLASCMHSTIVAGESITVPSQSNTISRYLKVLIDELLDFGGQRRLELDIFPGERMRECKPARVQEKPAHARLLEAAVQLEIAVFGVAEHRVAG